MQCKEYLDLNFIHFILLIPLALFRGSCCAVTSYLLWFYIGNVIKITLFSLPSGEYTSVVGMFTKYYFLKHIHIVKKNIRLNPFQWFKCFLPFKGTKVKKVFKKVLCQMV